MVQIKKRNASASRAKILKAARQCFAEHGYSATGIRDIAAAADVSYTLLSRYFGSKLGLLEATLLEALQDKPFLESARAEFGRSLAKLLIHGDGHLTHAMFVLSAADPHARKMATRVIESEVIEPLAKFLGPPNARQRAAAITMLGAGFVTHQHLLPLMDRPAARSENNVARWLAESFQRIVDGGKDWDTPSGSRKKVKGS